MSLGDRAPVRTPPSHGASGYKNFGCRCEVCAAAGSEYNRASEAKLRDGTWKPSHGTQRRALLGCGCDECAVVSRRIATRKAARQRETLARVTKRGRWTEREFEQARLLADEGVSLADIAVELGRSFYAVRHKVSG